jgi:hypothetical protein
MNPKQRRRIVLRQINLEREIEALEKLIERMAGDGILPHQTTRHLQVLKRLNRWYTNALSVEQLPLTIDGYPVVAAPDGELTKSGSIELKPLFTRRRIYPVLDE